MRRNILLAIKQLRRPVFTTRELAALTGSSLSTTTQALNSLQEKGLIFKVTRGIWAEVENERLSPYAAIPFLFPRHRAYVSFISALHLHGIIEQIPQVITLASTSHTRTIRTKMGTFSVHQIAPSLFNGFDWYTGGGNFLIAEPEKALVDSLYLSARKKKHFTHFPELEFTDSFSFEKAREWIGRIPDARIRAYVQKRLDRLLS